MRLVDFPNGSSVLDVCADHSLIILMTKARMLEITVYDASHDAEGMLFPIYEAC